MFQTTSTFDRSLKRDIQLCTRLIARCRIGNQNGRFGIAHGRDPSSTSGQGLQSARPQRPRASDSGANLPDRKRRGGYAGFDFDRTGALARPRSSAGAENSACLRRGGDSFGRGTVGRAVVRDSGRPAPPRRASREGRARAGGHRLDRVDPSRSRAARIGVSLALPNRRYGKAEDQSRRIADLSARVSSEPREIAPRRCRVAKATQEHPDACGASCLQP